MSGDLPSESSLREAFVAALAPYVVQRLETRGVEVDDLIADAIVDATALLDMHLAEFESTPIHEQRVSPLEIFRLALEPIVRALEIEGVEGDGDPRSSGAVPRDPYGLAPGSSQVLGPEAHMAHLRWGVEKAAALAPLVNRPATFVSDGPARDDVVAAVEEAGYRVVDDVSGDVRIAIVDADTPDAHSLISSASAAGVVVVVHGTDIDDLRATGLRALGANRVVATSALASSPGLVLPTLA